MNKYGLIGYLDRSYYEEQPEHELTARLLEDLAISGEEPVALQLAGAKLEGNLELGIEKDTSNAIELYERLV